MATFSPPKQHTRVRIPAVASRRVSWLGGVVATFSPPKQHTQVRILVVASKRVSWLGGVVVAFSPPNQHTRVRVPAAASGETTSQSAGWWNSDISLSTGLNEIPTRAASGQ